LFGRIITTISAETFRHALICVNEINDHVCVFSLFFFARSLLFDISP
jgi:hypothetical protein